MVTVVCCELRFQVFCFTVAETMEKTSEGVNFSGFFVAFPVVIKQKSFVQDPASLLSLLPLAPTSLPLFTLQKLRSYKIEVRLIL